MAGTSIGRRAFRASEVYVDALVLRDSGTGALNQRVWVQQDADWNVTALVNGSGSGVERDAYHPYGNRDSGERLVGHAERQRLRLFGRRSRAADGRSGTAPAGVDHRQRPAHRGDVNTDARPAGRGRHEKLARPGRPLPAMLLRAGADRAIKRVEVAFIELGAPVILAAVEEARFATLAEASGHPVNSGVMDAQRRGCEVGSAAAEEVNDDQVTEAEAGLTAVAQVPEQPQL